MLNQNLPKYIAVAEWIKQNIYNQTFKVGEKLISENQLCDKFSISRQTARQAIAILETEGLVIKKQGSGTYVNHLSLETKKISKTIGVLTTDVDHSIFPSILSGIEKVLSANGYHTTLRLTRNKVNTEREQLLTLLNSDIDGLIVEATKSALPNPNIDIYHQFKERQIPVLFINNYYCELDCHFIIVDDELGGELATRYLIDKGHRSITGIFKYDDIQGNLRYKGYLSEMYKQNLSIDESSIIWYSTENMDQYFSEENSSNLLKKLKNSTAIVCYNDQVALKLIQILSANNIKIPQDLSIVSFDNSSLSQIGIVPLTSITHPGKELGKLTAESILTIINQPHSQIKHIYKPEIMIRNSVHDLKK